MNGQGQQEGIAVPLEFRVPEDMVSRYATNIVVQHTANEFIVSFFEAYPPALLGSPDEIKNQAERITSIPANCVARIIIAPERMPEFVQVLKDNIEHYRKTVKPGSET